MAGGANGWAPATDANNTRHAADTACRRSDPLASLIGRASQLFFKVPNPLLEIRDALPERRELPEDRGCLEPNAVRDRWIARHELARID